MIRLPDLPIPQEVLDGLSNYQDKIIGTYKEKQILVKKASAPGFSSRNKRGSKVFDAIKVVLTEMCSGARRCAYCEDAPADEVEHIYPKDLFPDLCFKWENYLYACGPCNGPKSNQFAIIKKTDKKIVHLDGKRKPPLGKSLLIDPRKENPLDFARLNFATFHFEYTTEPDSIGFKRSLYTFDTVLRLNTDREYLRQARENAFSMYKFRLEIYHLKKNTLPAAQIQKMIAQLKKEAHTTVWQEVKKSYIEGRLPLLDPEFALLFDNNPEALAW